MYTYTYGGKNGKKSTLKISNDRVVVRTKNARSLNAAVHSAKAKKVLQKFEVEHNFPEADVCILHAKQVRSRSVSAAPKKQTALRDTARKVLKEEPELRFAGRVLVDDKADSPVLYTENLFIKFQSELAIDVCETLLESWDLKIKKNVPYAKNAYFASAPDNIGLDIFKLCNDLLKRPEVELCHPELVQHCPRKEFHHKQWHLQDTLINGIKIQASSNVAKAHKVTKGKGITIAIIDDGVDIDHMEFNIPGKVVGSRDVTVGSNDPRPKYWDENHGTACAGVAVAAGINASGVAPEAKLMPIRLASVLGSMAEADAFYWAAEKGADIISCSWGPRDGAWYVENDPAHHQYHPIPDSTRLAIEHAVKNGRDGKGCIICWAAGNGRENIMNDEYASNENVIAVGASNDSGLRSVYSDYGDAVWCVFPSGDFKYDAFGQPSPLTRGIYTTDRRGGGGYNTTDYTDDFTGTSSATPGVAGVIALMLTINPKLTAKEVKKLVAESCVKIDRHEGEYDRNGHSPYYGHGRLDALIAVQLVKVRMKKPAVPTRDNPFVTARLTHSAVRIMEALVNPKGRDAGNETITIKNYGSSTLSLTGWTLEDGKKRIDLLSGKIAKGATKVIALKKVKLPNTSGTLILRDSKGKQIAKVAYKAADVSRRTGKVKFAAPKRQSSRSSSSKRTKK